MGSSHKLSAWQEQVLREFFAREQGFFLTGGAALVGFYLGHRRTDDLDLFTADEDAFEGGVRTVHEIAAVLGAHLEARRTGPGFRRFVLTRGDDAVVVDLVLDRAAGETVSRPQRSGVVLDPPEEILANKLTALAARAEVRDLIDVMMLEREGLRVEDALEAALMKDGGCTPATLAWVLSQIEIADGAKLPGDVPAATLREYLATLIKRLRIAAFPPRS